MRVILNNSGTAVEIKNDANICFDSLLVNATTQLGWCPPLDWTKHDTLAEEVFENHGEKLPVGFFVCALEMGRTLHTHTLEKTHYDIATELATVESLLSIDALQDKEKHKEGLEYKELLRHDLQITAAALKKANGDSGASLTTTAIDVASPNPAYEGANSSGISQEGGQPPSSGQDGVSVPLVTEPHPNDVLLGRSSMALNHVGNVNFKILVATNKNLHRTLPKREKTLLTRSIVMAVKSQNPPGRFLQKDPKSNLWFEVGMQRAMEKASQALRDAHVPLAPTHHVMAGIGHRPKPRPVVLGSDGRMFHNNRNVTAARCRF